MEYTYGYLWSVGGGAWVVYPVGADPETSYVFMSPDGYTAAQHRVQADGDYCECVVKLPPLDLGDGMGACPSCNRPRR
jgi:hypothetical protein